MPALMAVVFGETRVSARVAKIRKSHVARPGRAHRKLAGALFDAAGYLSNPRLGHHRDPGVGGTLTLDA
jgi:hypothetical protein